MGADIFRALMGFISKGGLMAAFFIFSAIY